MVGAPVPEAGKRDRRIAMGLLLALNFAHGRSLGGIRGERGKAAHIVEVRHVARHEEEVEHVQGSRVVLFTRDRCAAAVSRSAALLFLENLENRTEIGLRLVAVDGRGRKAEATGEGRRDKVALFALVRDVRAHVVLPLVARVHAASRTRRRDKPADNLLVECLGLGITVPVVSPSHAPRSTGSVIVETFIVSNGSRSQGRLMGIPVAPVRDKTGRSILASVQVGIGLRDDARPGTAIDVLEKLEVGSRRIARVESVVPLVTRLNLVATDIVSGNPGDNLLGIAEVGATPLLGSHHESESGIEVSVRCRTSTAAATHTPVHTGAVAAIGLPSAIELVEHGLIVHVDGNQHAVSNSFGNGRAGSFRSEHPTLGSIIPALLPQAIMLLDHVRIGIFNNMAMRILLVLRERIAARHCRDRNHRNCARCDLEERFHKHPHFLVYPPGLNIT